jgi:hypothetical protein
VTRQEIDHGRRWWRRRRQHQVIAVDPELDSGSTGRLESLDRARRDETLGRACREVLLRPRGVRPQQPGNRVSSRPPILSDAASPVAVLFQTIPVEFVFPEHLQGLPLRIVVRASQPHDGRLTRLLRWNDLLDQPPSRPDLDQVTHFGQTVGW